MRLLKCLSITAAVVAILPQLAQAQTGTDLAGKFGAMESIQQISLSPDASKLAIVGSTANGQAVYIADLVAGGPPRPILGNSTGEGRVIWCGWATSSRILCGVYVLYDNAGQLLGFTRLVAMNSDGSKIVQVSARTNSRSLGILQHGGSVVDWNPPDRSGSVLLTRDFLPEASIGTNIRRSGDGFGVEFVDTETLRRGMVEPPRKDASEYISDGNGNIRIMGTYNVTADGYLRNQGFYYYRQPGSRDWKPLSAVELTENGAGFNPYAVDAAKNVVYGFNNRGGFSALYSIALDGTGKTELVLGRDDVDVDHLIQIGRKGRVVGVSYATERRAVEYFDPELRKLSTALSKAFPGNPAVSIIDASADEAKLLILASSDTNPGTFYLYDKATRQVEELLPVRSELAGQTLATMKPVTLAAADGTQIPAYLTLPPGSSGKGLPAIVMPHGGPGARDEWGFDWLAQFYAARGYAVLQPNYRGSAGYGSDWYKRNGFKDWRIAIGDVNDSGRWLVSQGIADPAKLAIVGWSYGGYAALQSSVLDPDLFKAIVAVAPVTDLERLRTESKFYSNFRLVDQFIGRGPHIVEGSPAQNASRIKAPVMLVHGTMDANVNVGESRLMKERLTAAGKQVNYIELEGLDHSLPSSAARKRLLGESDAFLRRALGMGPG